MSGLFLSNGTRAVYSIFVFMTNSCLPNSSYGHEIEMYTVEQGEKRDKRQ